MKTEFVVMGIPIPQGSQVYNTTKDGRAYGRYANQQHLMRWRESVAQAAWRSTNGEQVHGAVEVRMLFYFDRPKSHYTTKGLLKPNVPKFVTKKPDLDKVVRAIGDSLESSILMDGDESICSLIAHKYWADDHPQGVRVIVTNL